MYINTESKKQIKFQYFCKFHGGKIENQKHFMLSFEQKAFKKHVVLREEKKVLF